MKRIAAVLFLLTLSFAAAAQTNEAQALYKQGREAYTRGEPEKAVESFEKLVALQPNNAEYHYELATFYVQAGMRAGMLGSMSMVKSMKSELEKAIQLDPKLVPARYALMEFHLSAPSFVGASEEAAREQANAIRKLDPIEGHRAFARIHTAAKEPDLARKEYLDMVKEQPSSARAHYQYGVYLMLTDKNYKAAGDEFETAVKLDPAYMPAYFQIGHIAALSANNLARGEEMLKKYLAYQPKDDEPSAARAYYWLGGIYEKQGKKDQAKSTYGASLKINPNQKDVETAMKRVS
jgi:tetratricopeptide (TPR) repeat protein